MIQQLDHIPYLKEGVTLLLASLLAYYGLWLHSRRRDTVPTTTAAASNNETSFQVEERKSRSRLLQQQQAQNNKDKNDLKSSKVISSSSASETFTKIPKRKPAKMIIVELPQLIVAQTSPTRLSSPQSSPNTNTTSPNFSPSATDDHPGLKAFWNWWDVEMSLFRIYCLTRNDHNEVVPPYNPSSRRGHVQVSLAVTNQATNYPVISVYWVDYKGKEIFKGILGLHQTWNQTTWIDHPWVFRVGDEVNSINNTILCHYIPYRVIPTTERSPTVDPHDPHIGLHQFAIRNANANNPHHYIQIDDPVVPFRAQDHLITTHHAIAHTLLYCHRMQWRAWHVLIKYLSKIVQDPVDVKYRQIRISNPVFYQNIWQTPARGLLLAVGFVEYQGRVELGTTRPFKRVQDISQLIVQLEQWQQYSEKESQQQPAGADGYGRAGFGRVDGMNS